MTSPVRSTSTVALFASLALLASVPAIAQQLGTASGKGVMNQHAFSPRFALAYEQKGDFGMSTWLVLTEKEPPAKVWLAAKSAKESAEARRLWCEKEKASFAAVELDADGSVEMYYTCPGNGFVNADMVSVINGLAGVVVTPDKAAKKGRLQGTLRSGSGYCSKGDEGDYCEKTGDYIFDAPLSR